MQPRRYASEFGSPESDTGTSVQAVSNEAGGEYWLVLSRRCCVSRSVGDAGCRPSQQDRSFLQPTADSDCSASLGAPTACKPSQMSCVAPAQPLIASTCTQHAPLLASCYRLLLPTYAHKYDEPHLLFWIRCPSKDGLLVGCVMTGHMLTETRRS